MKAYYAIAALLAASQLAGCTWVREVWPWGREEEVPVTRPLEEAGAAEPAGTPTSRPAPVATAPATRPAAARPVVKPRPPGPAIAKATPPERIERPTNLTDLLYGPPRRPARKPAAATRPAAPTTRPGIADLPGGAIRVGTPATRPAVASVERPARPDGPTRPRPKVDVPIGRTILPPGARPKVTGPEQVVAASAIQVNRRFITVTDILRRLRPRLAKLPAAIAPEAFRQRVAPWIAEEVQEQVNRALVLAEADKRLTDQQKKQVDVEVQQTHNELLAEAGGSKTGLNRRLAKEGTTLEEILTEHRENAAFRLYLQSRFTPNIVITRKMLWNHYRMHHEEFSTAKKVEMQIVAVPFKSFLPDGTARPSAVEKQAARSEAKKVIEDAAEALKRGQDFDEVAKKFSRGLKAADGGRWPPMAVNTFRETEVEKAAFQLTEGQMAGPLETPSGFYIVKARRVVGGKVTSFEDAQEAIGKTLRNRRYMELTQEYFGDLHGKALIVRDEKFFDRALQKAAEGHYKP